MDFLTLQKLVGELSQALAEKPVVTRAFSTPGRSFALRLKFNDSWADLVLNLDSPVQGLWLTPAAQEIDSQLPIVRTANRLLINSRLMAVELLKTQTQAAFDRVVQLHFVSIDSFLGKRSDFFIICELTGKIADIFFCNSDQIIIDRVSRTSNNLVSDSYCLPESPPLLDPTSASEEKLLQVFARPSSDWKHYIGALSPKLEREICAMSDGKSESNLSILRQLLIQAGEPGASWVYYCSQTFKQVTISAYRLSHMENLTEKKFESANDAIAWVEASLVSSRRLDELKKRVLQGFEKELRQKNRLVSDQQQLIEKYTDHERLQNIGSLLTANIYQLKPGQKTVELEDWQTNEKMCIELDPTKTSAANAAKYFKLAKKYKRGVIEAEKRIEVLKSDIAWLHEQIWLTRSAETEKDIFIPPKPTNHSKPQSNGKKAAGRKTAKVHFPPLFELDHARFYVGRNARQNDIVTFQIARKGDYWFHANDVPGAHVILKKIEGTASETDLLRGATLAAWFSFARESGKVAVDCCEVSFVKKIPGAAAGRVSYSHQKTLMVNPADARQFLSDDT